MQYYIIRKTMVLSGMKDEVLDFWKSFSVLERFLFLLVLYSNMSLLVNFGTNLILLLSNQNRSICLLFKVSWAGEFWLPKEISVFVLFFFYCHHFLFILNFPNWTSVLFYLATPIKQFSWKTQQVSPYSSLLTLRINETLLSNLTTPNR